MLLVLTGQDAYRREEQARLILQAFCQKHGVGAVQRFDLEDPAALKSFFEFSNTPGLFDPFRLAILKNIGELTKPGEFKKYLKTVESSKSIIVLISEPSLTKEWAFLKTKSNTFEEFAPLPRGEFIDFLKKEAAKLGVKLSAEAFSLMADVYRGDALPAVNELKKLSFLKNKTISAEFLKNEEDLKQPHDFFYFVRGLSAGSMAPKLKNLETLLSLREDPAKIFNILAYLDLKNIGKFAEYDVLIKSGKLEYGEALLELVVSG